MKKENKKARKKVYKTKRACCLAAKEKPHVCPFSAEIHSDYESLCNCCEDCQHQCAMEI